MTGKLAILAGRGAMPKALAEAYPDAVCVTFDGVETPVPRVDAHHRFEAFGALLDDLKERGVERLVLAGGVGRSIRRASILSCSRWRLGCSRRFRAATMRWCGWWSRSSKRPGLR